MPFCRKCGRRLPEYSESCPDCGQSTTSPIINLKKVKGPELNLKTSEATKIVRVAAPKKTPAIVKAKPAAAVKAKVVSKTEPAIVLPRAIIKSEPPPSPKPHLSAKHIAKPKKAKQVKPESPFTLTFARPVAGHKVVAPKSAVNPRPLPQQVSGSQPEPIAQPNAVVALAKLASANAESAVTPSKTAIIISAKPTLVEIKVPPKKLEPPKHAAPAVVYPPHEIIKSKVSLKEDILSNPHDYETQTFDFDLECVHGHFWPAGKALPVSKGRAYCIQCGERLSKPKRKKQRRHHRF